MLQGLDRALGLLIVVGVIVGGLAFGVEAVRPMQTQLTVDQARQQMALAEKKGAAELAHQQQMNDLEAQDRRDEVAHNQDMRDAELEHAPVALQAAEDRKWLFAAGLTLVGTVLGLVLAYALLRFIGQHFAAKPAYAATPVVHEGDYPYAHPAQTNGNGKH